MFCNSKNDPDEKRPNANICPVCLGHPGTLPVINKEAVKHVLKVGAAISGKLADFSEFDRKNYFYPDIPKGYQISQYKYPLVTGGKLNGVNITRVHLEEDTATLVHEDEARINVDGNGDTRRFISDNPPSNQRQSASLVDFNRAGVPLLELVTEPVIHSAKEAGDFARELQLLLRYLGASDANMEKGEMRVEANISVARIPADEAPADSRGLLYEDLIYKIRGAAFAVYNALGSGHKESVYQNALAEEFRKIGIIFKKEASIAVNYNDKKVGSYQPDFVINDRIIIEIKALRFTEGIEKEQVRYYLKNSSYRLALIINFGSSPISIERIVYDSIRVNPRQSASSASATISGFDNPRQSASLGTKVEVKNLNSFRSVERAIEYEVKRHRELLEAGDKVVQETRGWDEVKQKTFSQRMKEESHDYRYFPDPDLPKLMLSEIPEFKPAALQKTLPELPWQKRARYGKLFGITGQASDTFIQYQKLALFFESAAKILIDKKLIALAQNYITSDLVGLIKETGEVEQSFLNLKFKPKTFAALIGMVGENRLSSRGAKDVLAVMYAEGGEPEAIAEAKGLAQKSNEGELNEIVKTVLEANPKVVTDYKSGKESALQFLVGQGMKASKGSANPQVLRKILLEFLK